MSHQIANYINKIPCKKSFVQVYKTMKEKDRFSVAIDCEDEKIMFFEATENPNKFITFLNVVQEIGTLSIYTINDDDVVFSFSGDSEYSEYSKIMKYIISTSFV